MVLRNAGVHSRPPALPLSLSPVMPGSPPMPGQPGAREHRRTLAAVSPWAELSRVSQQAGRLGLHAAAALAGLVSSCSGSPPPPGCPCLLPMWARMLVPGVASLSPRHPTPGSNARRERERERERLSGEET